MHANQLLRTFASFRDGRNWNCRRVGGKDTVIWCDAFHVRHNLPLEIQIFKDSFNNHISTSKVTFPRGHFVRESCDVARIEVVLILCHALALHLFLPVFVHIGRASTNSFIVAILKDSCKAFFGCYLRNASSHKPRPHDCHLLDWNGRIGTIRVLFHLGHTVKDTNQGLRFGSGSELGKLLAFVFVLVVARGVLQTILDTINNFERGRILAIGILLDHFLDLIPNDGATKLVIFQKLVHVRLWFAI
mmetsp:Transcript_18117/g.34609  ORF Transcript_18117/g.34609 Transcript_18117/m.34609 type:complete len:246 (-) Transcript_18117:945-1682(-)